MEQKLKGAERYPLVLMLEPLFKCNLSCSGCGKIQYPTTILNQRLTPDKCVQAAIECGAPVVTIAGGEPLLHPEIVEIVQGLIQRKKFIYLCTNGLLLAEKIQLFTPSKYLTFSLHLDGLKEDHDNIVNRQGAYDIATQAVRQALKRGFRVTTNTTLFSNADIDRVRVFFDEIAALGVEAMTISPGYSYGNRTDNDNFLTREKTIHLFSTLLGNAKKTWRFNQSPLFLEFLKGRRDYDCTPWGNPTYNIFGWQKPCYLINESYASTFAELMETTDWSAYGRCSGNTKCVNCMVHSGYEATAVNDMFSNIHSMAQTVGLSLFKRFDRKTGNNGNYRKIFENATPCNGR
jgi:hopanoid biosynthesis associated radical SAM protein HpnH